MSTITSTPRPTATAPASPPAPSGMWGEQRIAIRGLSWDLYDRLSDAIDEGQHPRLAYDGKDLEIMTTGLDHEDFKELLGQLVNAIADELHIPRRGLGETTWKRPEIERGVEADQCYLFQAEKLTKFWEGRKRGSKKLADFPNPDLAVEVEISPSLVDKPGIYAALKVAEIWRFDGESLVIEQLRPDGKYAPAESSRFLPVRAEEIVRWVLKEDTEDLAKWRERLRVWILAELAPRRKP
jgi:Uma2 family endonuclease